MSFSFTPRFDAACIIFFSHYLLLFFLTATDQLLSASIASSQENSIETERAKVAEKSAEAALERFRQVASSGPAPR
jgi:hypothetical protein